MVPNTSSSEEVFAPDGAISKPKASLLTIHYDVRALILEYALTSIPRIKPKEPETGAYHDIFSVSQTCWQLHNESKPIFYARNTFYIDSPIDYKKFNHLHQGASPTDSRISLPALFPWKPDFTKERLIMNRAVKVITTEYWAQNDFFDSDRAITDSWIKTHIQPNLRNLLYAQIGKSQVFELVISMADSFKLCKYHFDLHTRHHDIETESGLHMTHEEDCTGNMGVFDRSALAGVRPYAEPEEEDLVGMMKDSLVVERFYLKYGLQLSIGSRNFTLSWDIFHWDGPEQGTRERATCDWFRHAYLIELHKRFDGGAKKEKRMAWLLSLGGSDASGLCKGHLQH